jgi:hypothetical protein
MENAYQPELWRDVFVVLSTSTGALIGLLFVAIALHVDDIIHKPFVRRRSYNNMRYLVVAFVETVLVLIPQPTLNLGVGIVAINLFALCLPLRNIYLYFGSKQDYLQAGWTIYPAIIFVVTFLLGIAGGATLIENSNWGIYLVTIFCITLLVTVLFCAWSIMLGVGHDRAKRRDQVIAPAPLP